MTSALDINAEQQASIYQLAVGRYRDMFTGEDRPSPLLLSGEMSFNPAATFYMTSAGLLSSGYQNIRVQIFTVDGIRPGFQRQQVMLIPKMQDRDTNLAFRIR